MMILKYVRKVGAAALLTTALALPAAAQSAKAVLHDKSGKEVVRFNDFVKPDKFYTAMKCNVTDAKSDTAVGMK